MKQLFLLLFAFAHATVSAQADDFVRIVKPLLTQKCVKCHGKDEANADFNLQEVDSTQQFLANPELIQLVLEAIDTGAMPPDGEPMLDEETRADAVASLKEMLRESSDQIEPTRSPIQRLNRSQYNNVIRDLFHLNRDVFALPEKLMTRYDDYLRRPLEHRQYGDMPEVVHVASHSLNPQAGLQGVKPFPKDLRAEHGFDNQANQLTLSPLLLDAFLRLSVSIVESPDFNEQTVGIWGEFFQEPAEGSDRRSQVRRRLARFMRLAFRGPVDDDALNRYTAYAESKIEQGLSFPESMKKVASAVLSSPLFIYRTPATDDSSRQLELASRLSFFLWSSCPDDELLALAEDGLLSDPEVLNRTVTRMLADPKIERFLDSFPSQWMQLENLRAATPDPNINKYFSLDGERPASVQMVLEPLLLFDAVFVEDRPIIELIAPTFSYRSDYLQTWYSDNLNPPPIDAQQIAETNQRNDQRRSALQAAIVSTQRHLDELIAPVRMQLLEERSDEEPVASHPDLKPFAVWEFNGDLTESVRGLDLTAYGDVEFRDGLVVLQKSHLLSKPLPVDLNAKSLEIWFRLDNLDQRGGGLMGIQGPGDWFDTIVIGERKGRHWISGSNGFSRTDDFPESVEETVTDEILHLVMVYANDGTTTLYRNGQPYGKPYRKGQTTFPREKSAVIFGLRHLPPGGNKFLSVAIDQARLYNRALTADEAAVLASGNGSFISDKELTTVLTPQQRTQKQRLTAAIDQNKAKLQQIPANVDLGKATQDAQRAFENELREKLRSREFRRVAAEDPRYGGVITNAAMLSMTSGPKRTHPVARGVWIIEVIFNDPPPPPPNDVPPLDEESGAKELTIREQFAAHRANPSCAGCHTKLDPLGFAMENFDITGRWRDQYGNGRDVDASGTLLRQYEFEGVVQFKQSLVKENHRFAKAFAEHLLRYAMARELAPHDALTIDAIVASSEPTGFRIQSVIRNVVLSECFQGTN